MNFANTEVDQLYEQYLHRSAFADPEGMATWVNDLRAGASIEQVSAALVSSTEFIQGQTDGSFNSWLDAFYRDVFGRPVDAWAWQPGDRTFQAGQSRQQIALAIYTLPAAPGASGNEYQADLVELSTRTISTAAARETVWRRTGAGSCRRGFRRSGFGSHRRLGRVLQQDRNLTCSRRLVPRLALRSALPTDPLLPPVERDGVDLRLKAHGGVGVIGRQEFGCGILSPQVQLRDVPLGRLQLLADFLFRSPYGCAVRSSPGPATAPGSFAIAVANSRSPASISLFT